MKRLLLVLIAAWFLIPSGAFAAASCDDSVILYTYAPVCACYHDVSYCDLYYPGTSGFDEAACTTYCQQQYGDKYVSSAEHDGKDTCDGKAVASACTATNATARLAERTGSASAAAGASASAPGYATPELNVAIPNLTFDKAVSALGVVNSNFIGTYVTGVYQFLIGFAMTVAIVMVMIGGVQYVVGGTTGELGKAKERITNAVTGFVLLMFVYVILFVVNPNLTSFPNIQLTSVPPAPEEWEDDSISGASIATSFATPGATNVSGAAKTKVPSDLTADIDDAAATMARSGYGLSITSGLRSVEDQLQLIYKNCQNAPGSSTCNPKPGRPTTCILKDNDPANCPHTTGRALDVWGTKDGGQCITQDACMADKTACRANACQGALIAAMRAEGFCNLASEPWHFEKPKMSSTCN